LYQAESEQDPQKAYDAIVSDYSLTCGNIANAVAGAGGEYRSPIYVVLNQWGPAPDANPHPSPAHSAHSRARLATVARSNKDEDEDFSRLCLLLMAMSAVIMLSLFYLPGHSIKAFSLERRLWLMLPLGTLALVATLGLPPPHLGEVRRYSFHSWDLLCWIRAVPQPVASSDAAASRLLRDAFHQFALNGELSPRVMSS
jgi:hypothetical protein